MPVPSPTNCWTSIERQFATATANSAAFITMVGAANASEATTLVFGEQLNEPLNGEFYEQSEREQELNKYAQVYSAPDQPYGKRRLQSQRFEAFGVTRLYLERLVADVERDKESDVPQYFETEFKNIVGNVIEEIIAYMFTNGGPIIQQVIVDDGPGWNEKHRWPDEGAWQGCGMLFEWGLDG